MLTLITGGARSGKSRFAQSLCRDAAQVVYIATALPSDTEMQARIAHHQRNRPATWQTIEEPLNVPEAVARHAPQADIILIDCVTIWVSNLLYESCDSDFIAVEELAMAEIGKLIEAAKLGNVLAVSNEVGSGIVPASEVARRFRDIQGMVNQQLALASESVYLVVSGIPVRIKPSG